MSDVVVVAVVTGCIALLNGPIVVALMNRRFKKSDELVQIKSDIARLFKLVDRIGMGLDIGLRNDKVIFKAFRENCINGDSEAQERVMDEYFTGCAIEGFKSNKEE